MGEPADTLAYMTAGFIVIFGAIIVYIFSLVYRWRRYHREIRGLEQRRK